MEAATTTHPADRTGAGESQVAALRCPACGSREPVRAPARRHGWQRCGHCRGVIVAPWSAAEAFEGPQARTVVLQLPGRAHFMVPRRTLLTTLELALWLFVVFLLTAFSVSAFEIDVEPGSAWRWLGPLLGLLAGGSVAALCVRRWATVQHLEISSRRLVACRSVGGRRFARVERHFERGLGIAAEEGIETVSACRFRLRLRTEGPGEKPVDLLLPSRIEAAWVAALVGVAVAGADGTRSCPGCGAPVPIGLEQRAAGSATCRYCEAGFIVDVRGMRWEPVALPCPAVPPGAPAPPRVAPRRRRRRGETIRFWEIRPGALGPRLFAAAGLGANAALFGAFGVASLWISRHTPPGAFGLTAFLLGCSLMMFAIAAAAALLVSLALLGRDFVGVDEATLQSGTLLGGRALTRIWRVPGRGAGSFGPSGWRSGGGALPVARLTRVAWERKQGATLLRFHTPTRSLELGWSLPEPDDRWLRHALAMALAERLRALGRGVVLQSDESGPGPG